MSSLSAKKIIKFGWDFTKLYQFNVKEMEMCSFLGHPVYVGYCDLYILRLVLPVEYVCCLLQQRNKYLQQLIRVWSFVE